MPAIRAQEVKQPLATTLSILIISLLESLFDKTGSINSEATHAGTRQAVSVEGFGNARVMWMIEIPRCLNCTELAAFGIPQSRAKAELVARQPRVAAPGFHAEESESGRNAGRSDDHPRFR